MASISTTLAIRSAAPKIDGSAVGEPNSHFLLYEQKCTKITLAGFIVLVVCLVLIIVASTFAILYLIREERSQGIFRFTHRRQQRSASSTPFIRNASSDHRPWTNKLLKFFHSRSDSKDSSVRDRSDTVQDGHRWYQSASGDSWDHTVPRVMEARNATLEPYPYSASPPPLPETNLPNPFERRALIYNHDSSGSSVHLDLSDPRKASSLSSPAFSQSNPNSPSHLDLHRAMSSPHPDSLTHVIASSSSLRSGSPIPRRTVSPGPEPTAPQSIAHRTFEGGSKFLEAI